MNVQPFHKLISDGSLFNFRIWKIERLKQGDARVDAAIMISGELKGIWPGDRLLKRNKV